MERKLEEETLKWLERIKLRIKYVEARDEKGKEFLKNINAYILDSEYFLRKRDLIKAFECVVWAWAWLEIGIDINVLEEHRTDDI